MRRICINFAPASSRKRISRLNPVVGAAGVVAISLALVGGWRAAILWLENDTIKLEIDRQIERRATLENRQRAHQTATLPATQVTAVNQAISRLNLPWRDILDAIAAATPASIALLSLEPDASARVLRGTAEAKNGEEMIAYIEQLKRQEFFTSVVLQKHDVNEQNPLRPLRFRFEARWPEKGQR